MSGVQNGHCVPCPGYHQSTVTTGYDAVIPHRSMDLYCVTAKEKGKVISLDDMHIGVQYDSGQGLSVEIGRRFGLAAGLVVPHEIITPLKVGDRFNVGDVISYNSGFFEPDYANPKKVIYKDRMNVRTVLWESQNTIEDACALSATLLGSLKTNSSKIKTLVLNSRDEVLQMVNVGDHLDFDTPLCFIMDEVSAAAGVLDTESIDTLKALGKQTPRAGSEGVVEKIEVFYFCDVEDLSESIKKIAKQSNRELSKKLKGLGKEVYTGQVDGGFRVDGTPLSVDQVAIRIYLSHPLTMGVGDKAVFCNQLKTIVSEILPDDMVTENGQRVQAAFGWRSVDARVVMSAILIGCVNNILEGLTEIITQ